MGKASQEYKEARQRANAIEAGIYPIQQAQDPAFFASRSKQLGEQIDLLGKQLAKLIDWHTNGEERIAEIRAQANAIRDRAEQVFKNDDLQDALAAVAKLKKLGVDVTAGASDA